MGRTLVVTNDFPPRRGGIENFVRALVDDLPPAEVVVYTARMSGSEGFDAERPYPVLRDRAAMLLPTRRVASEVQRAARRYDCDHVVFGAAAPLGLLARGLRAQTGVGHVTALTHGHEVWWARVPGARRLLRRIGDDADVVTYVSEYCRERIATALSPDARRRMQPLVPAVDTTRFHPGVDGTPWRSRLRLPDDATVVLSASRLVRRKGQDVLVTGWQRVLAAEPQARLVIVGDGPSRRRLERLARRSAVAETITVVPGVPWTDMPAVYAMADVFALPCRTRLWGLEPEAFGIVFLEAAASGLEVVVGNSGGAAEAAALVGGALVDGTDVDAVGDAVILAVRRLRPRSV